MPDTSERLKRLEDQVRGLRIALLVTIGVAVGALATGATSGDSETESIPLRLRANAFELFDHNGSLRAVLGLQAGNTPELRMLDKEGQVTARLWTDGMSSGLLVAMPQRGDTVRVETGALGPTLGLSHATTRGTASASATVEHRRIEFHPDVIVRDGQVRPGAVSMHSLADSSILPRIHLVDGSGNEVWTVP
jgi:hypothetical protein